MPLFLKCRGMQNRARTVATHYEEVHDLLDPGTLGTSDALNGTGKTAAHGQPPIQITRSHAIFTITMEQIHKVDLAFSAEEEQGEETDEDYLCAKLHLVELSGSENAKRTGSDCLRFKEARTAAAIRDTLRHKKLAYKCPEVPIHHLHHHLLPFLFNSLRVTILAKAAQRATLIPFPTRSTVIIIIIIIVIHTNPNLIFLVFRVRWKPNVFVFTLKIKCSTKV
ncbi:Kinesin-like protein [Nymphaea thermarum]|nr:Kinesin-like protein [Nymphaea thermarum]